MRGQAGAVEGTSGATMRTQAARRQPQRRENEWCNDEGTGGATMRKQAADVEGRGGAMMRGEAARR